MATFSEVTLSELFERDSGMLTNFNVAIQRKSKLQTLQADSTVGEGDLYYILPTENEFLTFYLLRARAVSASATNVGTVSITSLQALSIDPSKWGALDFHKVIFRRFLQEFSVTELQDYWQWLLDEIETNTDSPEHQQRFVDVRDFLLARFFDPQYDSYMSADAKTFRGSVLTSYKATSKVTPAAKQPQQQEQRSAEMEVTVVRDDASITFRESHDGSQHGVATGVTGRTSRSGGIAGRARGIRLTLKTENVQGTDFYKLKELSREGASPLSVTQSFSPTGIFSSSEQKAVNSLFDPADQSKDEVATAWRHYRDLVGFQQGSAGQQQTQETLSGCLEALAREKSPEAAVQYLNTLIELKAQYKSAAQRLISTIQATIASWWQSHGKLQATYESLNAYILAHQAQVQSVIDDVVLAALKAIPQAEWDIEGVCQLLSEQHREPEIITHARATQEFYAQVREHGEEFVVNAPSEINAAERLQLTQKQGCDDDDFYQVSAYTLDAVDGKFSKTNDIKNCTSAVTNTRLTVEPTHRVQSLMHLVHWAFDNRDSHDELLKKQALNVVQYLLQVKFFQSENGAGFLQAADINTGTKKRVKSNRHGWLKTQVNTIIVEQQVLALSSIDNAHVQAEVRNVLSTVTELSSIRKQVYNPDSLVEAASGIEQGITGSCAAYGVLSRILDSLNRADKSLLETDTPASAFFTYLTLKNTCPDEAEKIVRKISALTFTGEQAAAKSVWVSDFNTLKDTVTRLQAQVANTNAFNDRLLAEDVAEYQAWKKSQGWWTRNFSWATTHVSNYLGEHIDQAHYLQWRSENIWFTRRWNLWGSELDIVSLYKGSDEYKTWRAAQQVHQTSALVTQIDRFIDAVLPQDEQLFSQASVMLGELLLQLKELKVLGDVAHKVFGQEASSRNVGDLAVQRLHEVLVNKVLAGWDGTTGRLPKQADVAELLPLIRCLYDKSLWADKLCEAFKAKIPAEILQINGHAGALSDSYRSIAQVFAPRSSPVKARAGSAASEASVSSRSVSSVASGSTDAGSSYGASSLLQSVGTALGIVQTQLVALEEKLDNGAGTGREHDMYQAGLATARNLIAANRGHNPATQQSLISAIEIPEAEKIKILEGIIASRKNKSPQQQSRAASNVAHTALDKLRTIVTDESVELALAFMQQHVDELQGDFANLPDTQKNAFLMVLEVQILSKVVTGSQVSVAHKLECLKLLGAKAEQSAIASLAQDDLLKGAESVINTLDQGDKEAYQAVSDKVIQAAWHIKSVTQSRVITLIHCDDRAVETLAEKLLLCPELDFNQPLNIYEQRLAPILNEEELAIVQQANTIELGVYLHVMGGVSLALQQMQYDTNLSRVAAYVTKAWQQASGLMKHFSAQGFAEWLTAVNPHVKAVHDVQTSYQNKLGVKDSYAKKAESALPQAEAATADAQSTVLHAYSMKPNPAEHQAAVEQVFITRFAR